MAKSSSKQVSLPFLTDLIVFNYDDVSFTLRGVRKIRPWISDSITKEKKELGFISITLCSDKTLLSINKKHLQHDYYTDIITFDFCEGDLISGDLYISIDRVKENAKGERNTMNQELKRVIIHGVLHLCGYKDKTPKDARQIREMEDYYLSLFP